MSQHLGIQFERTTYPEGLIPATGRYGNGECIPYALRWLFDVCRDFGLTPLDHFIVDHCALVEEALEEAGWVGAEPYLLREVIGEDPTDTDQFVTRYEHSDDDEPKRFAVYDNRAAYDRASRWSQEIEAEVERGKPWFPPDEGLRTVCGLIALGKRGVTLGNVLPELRTIELGLRYAKQNQDRFHFSISY